MSAGAPAGGLSAILFWVLACAAVLAAIATVSANRPIRSAVFLLTHVFCLAGLYALLSAHLLAALQVLVYAGAVVVLFVFVIMLLGPTAEVGRGPGVLRMFAALGASALACGLHLWRWSGRPEAAVFTGVMVLLGFSLPMWKTGGAVISRLLGSLALAFAGYKLVSPLWERRPVATLTDGFGTVRAVGHAMFHEHVLLFEVASVLLLVAIVGAVAVAKKPLGSPGKATEP